jgi:transcriptional regulator with XRE-family HTH domain
MARRHKAIARTMTKKEQERKLKKGYGERIAKARKGAGYSQKALMKALGWPADSNARLSGYENEDREPTLVDFERIAKLCHVPPGYLAFGDWKLDKFHQYLIQGYESADDNVQRIVRSALRLAESGNKRGTAD